MPCFISPSSLLPFDLSAKKNFFSRKDGKSTKAHLVSRIYFGALEVWLKLPRALTLLFQQLHVVKSMLLISTAKRYCCAAAHCTELKNKTSGSLARGTLTYFGRQGIWKGRDTFLSLSSPNFPTLAQVLTYTLWPAKPPFLGQRRGGPAAADLSRQARLVTAGIE